MKHFTLTEREILSKMIKEKQTYRKMSLVLNKSSNSVFNEIKRNSKIIPYLINPALLYSR